MTVEGLNLKYETIAASGMIEMPEIHDFHLIPKHYEIHKLT